MTKSFVFLIVSIVLCSCSGLSDTRSYYYFDNMPYSFEKHQNKLYTFDKLILKDSYTKESLEIKNYVLSSLHVGHNPGSQYKYFKPSPELKSLSLEFLSQSFENQNIEINFAEELIWKIDEELIQHSLNDFAPEIISEEKILQLAGTEQNKLVLVPLISYFSRVDQGAIDAPFFYSNCLRLGIYIIKNNEVIYGKSGAVCNISRMHRNNPKSETELTQAEWDLLVYELMREYLERLE